MGKLSNESTVKHPLWPEFKKWAEANLGKKVMYALYWEAYKAGALAVRRHEANLKKPQTLINNDEVADGGDRGKQSQAHPSEAPRGFDGPDRNEEYHGS